MGSRRTQILFLTLVAVLIISRGLVGVPSGMTLQEVWHALTR
ncbi:hypothetical protein [uncultured Alsobacter sp.]|nr:hypothetical protein [uncultured Alsobacter sp.]